MYFYYKWFLIVPTAMVPNRGRIMRFDVNIFWFLITPRHNFFKIYSQRYPIPTYLFTTEIKFNRTCIIGTQPFSWPSRKKGQQQAKQQHSASAIYSSPRNRQPAYFLEKSSKPCCASTSRTRFVCSLMTWVTHNK